MNFVIFSRDFYPQKTAEAYCATRFASALAKAGHSVHVVTVECDAAQAGDYSALVHPAVRISYVPAKPERGRWPHFSLKYLTILDADSVNLPAYVAVTRQVLRLYEKPVLITRSQPMASLYVGWQCRRQAHKWVAHLSDAMPWGERETRLDGLARQLKRFWLRRAFAHADLMSVTCKRAFRFYRETLGPVVGRVPQVVATHIGDMKLGTPRAPIPADDLGANVVRHEGDIYLGRGARILEAVGELNRNGLPCEFVQMRPVAEEDVVARFKANGHCHLPGKDDAETLRRLAAASRVSFVADFDSTLSYSPFLMSKFVYQLFTDDPIVVFAKRDSEKHDYCETYPEAGLFFADQDHPEELAGALRRAFEAPRAAIDRSRIRARFSEERIAADFLEKVNAL